MFVINTSINTSAEAIEKSLCHFTKIPTNVARMLVEKGEMLDAAGGFKVDNSELKPFIEKIEGDENSFKGLPLTTLKNLLAQVGYHS